MTNLQSIVLGLVQGLSEFLPISSSGHLILVPLVTGWSDQGLTFDEVVAAGSAGPPLLEMAATVVHALHDAGFVHRDLKASNLLLGRDGRLRVVDLDGARRAPRGPSLARRARDLARLAASVEVLGGDAAALVESYADAAALSGARRDGLRVAVAAASA